MKVQVFGVQRVEFTDKDTGEHVTGTRLHVCFKDAYVDGQAVDKIFISDRLGLSVVSEIKPGMTVDLEYNNRRRLCDVLLCK